MPIKNTALSRVLPGVRFHKGRLLAADGGLLLVQREGDDSPVVCKFLRTSILPAPVFAPGDSVLFLLDAGGGDGFVLGVIEPAGVELPASISLHAADTVEIRCGRSRLSLHADGRVLVRGVEVTSRASRTNKIKGAAVKIN